MLSLTAPALPEGVQEFIDHVHAQPINEWHSAPLSKAGKKLKGDTAAGQTIEAVLKIAVNNSDGPDIPRGRIEVKAGRASSVCPTTLLTKSPCWPKGANRSMITNFGYACEENPDDVRRLMVCMSATKETTHREGVTFNLVPCEANLSIVADNVIVAGYEREKLLTRAERKLGGVLAHFEAESRMVDDEEQFRITSLNLYWGYDGDKFWSNIQSGNIVVEPRLKMMGGKKLRDRGTAFRCSDPSILYAFAHRVI